MSGDIAVLVQLGLVLSIPFLLGVIVGRGIRKPAETPEHRAGVELAKLIEGVRTQKSWCGNGVIVSRAFQLKFSDGRVVTVGLKAEDA